MVAAKPVIGVQYNFNLLKALYKAKFPSSLAERNYDKYVKLSQELDGDVFNRLESAKPAIGNFAKQEGLRLEFKPSDAADEFFMTGTKDKIEVVFPEKSSFVDMFGVPKPEPYFYINQEEFAPIAFPNKTPEGEEAFPRSVYKALYNLIKCH